jgi:hypothetical protein
LNQLSRVRPLLPEGEERGFTLQADYLGGQIDLKAFCAAHQHHPILGTNPLVLEPQKDCFVFLSRFGGVVFWDCPEALVAGYAQKLPTGMDHHPAHLGRDPALHREGSSAFLLTWSEVIR